MPITFAQAVLGSEIEIPTIHGKERFVIREGTQPGDVVTLKNKGIPVINRPGQFGDQIVTLNLEVPHHLTDAQKEAIRSFDQSCTAGNYHKQDSFFKKLRDLFA